MKGHELLIAFAALWSTVGCVGTPARSGPVTPAMTPQVRHGPGVHVNPHKVLALSATCGSVEFSCPRSYIDTVDSIVRSTMDFAGYNLVLPDQLLNKTIERQENHTNTVVTDSSRTTTVERRAHAFDRSVEQTHQGQTQTTRSEVSLSGSRFQDLSVAERNDVLRRAGADSVLAVRIVVGAQNGVWTPDQSTEVMVKLSVDNGNTLAWASRCHASSNRFSTVNAALEYAARCAIHGGTGD